MQFPDSVQKVNTSFIDDGNGGYIDHKAYCYEWYNVTLDKTYIGASSKPFGSRVYWHSVAECKDLVADVENGENVFYYSIIDIGTVPEMFTAEHVKLKEVDAVNNPKYYNESNGSPHYKPSNSDNRRDFVRKLCLTGDKKGVGCDWLQEEPILISEIVKVRAFQCRSQTLITDQIRYVKERCDEACSTKGCNPPVLLENFFGKDEHVTVNGNNTIAGASESTKVTKIKYILVPESVWKKLYNFNNAEIRLIAYTLNAEDELKRTTNKVEDLVKGLLDNFYDKESKMPVDARENRDFLQKDCNLSYNQATRVINIALKKVAEEDNRIKGQSRINWKESDDKKLLNKMMEVACQSDNNVIAEKGASGSTKNLFYSVLEKFEAANSKIKDPKKWKRVCKLYIYHTTEITQKDWERKHASALRAKFDFLEKATASKDPKLSGLRVEFVMLDLHRADGLVKENVNK